MQRDRPTEWHLQDWGIVVQALVEWAGPPDDVDSKRAERAWVLIEAIARDQGLSPSEFVRQTDHDWLAGNT